MVYSGLEDRTENLPPAQSFVIKFDDENYPVLPSWGDDEGKSLLELRSLLGDYFSELWSKYFTAHLHSDLMGLNRARSVV